MMLTKYYGAPGTGKTYQLIKKVEEELERGLEIKEIGYLGFTRAAANEASRRVTEKFGLKDKQLWFRTIHSTCLYLLRIRGRKEKVVGFREKKTFCERQDMIYTWEGEDSILGDHIPDGNLFFDIYSYLENTMMDVGDWRLTPFSAGFNRDFSYLYDRWTEYKTGNELIDFADMIRFALDEMVYLPTKVLLVDEFQDLSPLQYNVVKQFMMGKERVYCGGDDDQAIYRFQGASPEIFLNMRSNENHVLPKSYRLPSNIWEMSKILIKQNTRRQEKEIEPRAEGGSVEFMYYPRPWNVMEQITNNTYLLFRTNYLMNQFGWDMAKEGILYKFLDGGKEKALGWSNKKKYDLYHRLVNKSDYRRQLQMMESRGEISRGYAYFVQNYLDNYRKKINVDNITTYIGTIHSAKGREADTVILFDDITGRVAAGMRDEEGLEDERRVFYVGMTRAREKLVIVNNGFGSKTLSFDLPSRLEVEQKRRIYPT